MHSVPRKSWQSSATKTGHRVTLPRVIFNVHQSWNLVSKEKFGSVPTKTCEDSIAGSFCPVFFFNFLSKLSEVSWLLFYLKVHRGFSASIAKVARNTSSPMNFKHFWTDSVQYEKIVRKQTKVGLAPRKNPICSLSLDKKKPFFFFNTFWTGLKPSDLYEKRQNFASRTNLICSLSKEKKWKQNQNWPELTTSLVKYRARVTAATPPRRITRARSRTSRPPQPLQPRYSLSRCFSTRARLYSFCLLITARKGEDCFLRDFAFLSFSLMFVVCCSEELLWFFFHEKNSKKFQHRKTKKKKKKRKKKKKKEKKEKKRKTKKKGGKRRKMPIPQILQIKCAQECCSIPVVLVVRGFVILHFHYRLRVHKVFISVVLKMDLL